MKRLLLVLPLVLNFALAKFSTTVEDDIFAGKKATMFTSTNFQGLGILLFGCKADEKTLTMAYVEKDSNPSVTQYDVKILIKVDDNTVHTADGKSGKRNENYVQVETDDREVILAILKEMKLGKQKYVGGFKFESGAEGTFNGNLKGSTKATDEFVSACKLTLP